MPPVNAPVIVYRMSTPEHECPWGLRAISLLQKQGVPFTDMPLRSPAEIDVFKAKYGVSTTPQIFFGDQRIGGYTDLADYFQVKAETADYSYWDFERNWLLNGLRPRHSNCFTSISIFS
ncbi:glutaredoxin [Gloeomargarita lithophora Alchichica-D10]|uniref:Glutaredoxin n=1 Tax=Gloeomargarita lithophora Alchichica-D10 TaxID=1188229 RepID=A0A1J0AEP4_9CYAN|nr:glutaredoxin [Gloeomargarita lithophora Alchichica-D10]